jgi:hypothetical protein
MERVERMTVSIDNTSWSDVPRLELTTDGCGCCSNHIPITRKSLLDAIKEHEEFIVQLKELLKNETEEEE